VPRCGVISLSLQIWRADPVSESLKFRKFRRNIIRIEDAFLNRFAENRLIGPCPYVILAPVISR
jgi:hypothetical protein